MSENNKEEKVRLRQLSVSVELSGDARTVFMTSKERDQDGNEHEVRVNSMTTTQALHLATALLDACQLAQQRHNQLVADAHGKRTVGPILGEH